jgi:hypothetical protein
MPLALLLLAACKPKVPSQVIQPGEMEDVLYDYYLAQGMSYTPSDEGAEYSREYNRRLALKKHGYTQADFDSSLVWYFNHLEELFKIYESVQHRLGEDALAQGTSVRELQQFTTYSHTSDTTDVWEGKRYLLLYPQAPFHIYQFKQKADSTYHVGDSFLFTYGTTFFVQSGTRSAQVYLALTYDNDSVATRDYAVPSSGIGTIRIPSENHALKELRGYIIMNRRGKRNMDNETCMLFLDRIQLLRIHKKKEDAANNDISR